MASCKILTGARKLGSEACAWLCRRRFFNSPMNTNKIGQIFQGLAKVVTESLDTQSEASRIPKGRIPAIRGGMVLTERASEAYIEALDEIEAIAGADATWSRSTVDDVLWEHVDRVVKASTVERPAAIRLQADEIVKRFGEMPSVWTVDLLVYGMDSSCADLKFGRVAFFSDQMNIRDEYRSALKDLLTGKQMFARLETAAIDEQSAVHRAAGILDEHLAILNSLCSLGSPSLVRVSRLNHIHQTYGVNRVGRSVGSMGSMGFQGFNTRVPLARSELESLLKHELGARVSKMLSSPESEFSKRVLSGYALAGTACVDAHPERMFLMFAIALESVVLGKDTQSELTHQLATRVAHLIGNGPSGRKHVAEWVSKLYRRRSKIVHTGEYGVSRTDSGLVRFYCMAVLGNLALLPAFERFTTNDHLENWFRERTLEGPYFVGPKPSA